MIETGSAFVQQDAFWFYHTQVLFVTHWSHHIVMPVISVGSEAVLIFLLQQI